MEREEMFLFCLLSCVHGTIGRMGGMAYLQGFYCMFMVADAFNFTGGPHSGVALSIHLCSCRSCPFLSS